MASSVFSSSPVAIIVLITSFLLTKAEDLGRAHVRGVNKSKYPASMRGLQIEEWTGDECPCGVYESCGICLQDDLAGTCKPCKYETKDNIGIYCPVGKGMVRNIDGMLADYQDSSTLAAGGDQNPNGGDQIEVRTVRTRREDGSDGPLVRIMNLNPLCLSRGFAPHPAGRLQVLRGKQLLLLNINHGYGSDEEHFRSEAWGRRMG